MHMAKWTETHSKECLDPPRVALDDRRQRRPSSPSVLRRPCSGLKMPFPVPPDNESWVLIVVSP